jgi:hypothetical protein
MNQVVYYLCQKPVVGVLMWIMSACTLPPIFSEEPIDLTTSGAKVVKSFSVPVDKKYPLAIDFKFESINARLNDKIVGDRYSEYCQNNIPFEQIPEIKRQGLGVPISFKVVIRNVKDNSIVINKFFESLCVSSHSDNKKIRVIGYLELPKGEYIAEISNIKAQTDLMKVSTSLSLYDGLGKG